MVTFVTHFLKILITMEDRMMLLENQVRALHSELDDEIKSFQASTGLHCLNGCGKCCLKPDIEAAPLEFLPLAMSLHREGLAEAWLEKLQNQEPICKVYDEGQSGPGKCSRYNDRGMICRLFGYSARKNKYGQKEILTCTIIKEEQKKLFELASAEIQTKLSVPVAADYYARLRAIDQEYGSNYLPVNKAILIALQIVLTYYHYKGRQQA